MTAGGKGVNVARALRALGFDATLLGLLPGRMGDAVVGLLADEAIALLGVPVAGELRSAFIIHERDGRATVLNEPGRSSLRRTGSRMRRWPMRRSTSTPSWRAWAACRLARPTMPTPASWQRRASVGARAWSTRAARCCLRALDETPDIVCPISRRRKQCCSGRRVKLWTRRRSARAFGRGRALAGRRRCANGDRDGGCGRRGDRRGRTPTGPVGRRAGSDRREPDGGRRRVRGGACGGARTRASAGRSRSVRGRGRQCQRRASAGGRPRCLPCRGAHGVVASRKRCVKLRSGSRPCRDPWRRIR